MSAALGELEMRLLADAQARRRGSIRAGDMVTALGWTAAQERKVLSRLTRKGLIARVRRGLYLVPPRLPLGGRWSPGEFLALSTLMADRGGRYQISGPNAFSRYGWTEQIPNRLYAYNNRISGDRRVGPVVMTLIKVADERLGGTEVVRTPDGVDVVYASKARALVDAVNDWSRFDSLPRAFEWISQEVKADDRLASELVRATIEYGNQGTARRVGVLLEQLGVQPALLRRLERAVRSSSSLIPWVPNRGKRREITGAEISSGKRWGVVINDRRTWDAIGPADPSHEQAVGSGHP